MPPVPGNLVRAACFLQWALLFLLLSPIAAVAEESLAEQRKRFEGMEPAEQEDLLRHHQQFQSLAPAEQRRIRRLHEQLEQDREGKKLREIMDRYSQWLATLPPYRRAELLELEPAKRVKQIKRLVDEQAKIATRQLPEKDREGVLQWMEQYATAHEARLLETLAEPRRQQAAKTSPAMRHRVAMGILCQRWLAGSPAVHPPVSTGELSDLRKRLSPEIRARVESKPAGEQLPALTVWLRQVARQELMTRRSDGSVLPGFDEQLADFFEFHLNDDERDRLLGLPGEEMQQRLREMYLLQWKSSPPAARPGQAKKQPVAEKPRPKKLDKEPKPDKPPKKEPGEGKGEKPAEPAKGAKSAPSD